MHGIRRQSPLRFGTVAAVPDDALPPDPFADDPNDPTLALEDNDVEEPLDDQERADLVSDLADLAVFQALLAPRGVRGIVVDCQDCGEYHYHEWDMLRANLEQLLNAGRMRPHEPAHEPDPNAYVTWDYCRGYADAVMAEDEDLS